MELGAKVDVTWSSGNYIISGETYRRNSSVMKCIPKPALAYWKQKQLRQATINNVLDNLEQIQTLRQKAKTPDDAQQATYDFVSQIGRGDSEALVFGSQVHQMVEDAVQGIKADYNFTVTAGHRNAANGAFVWLRQHRASPAPGPIVEMVVFNPEHRIAGRLDYWHGHGAFCADWKTGKALYADYAVQLVLYTRFMTHAIIPMSDRTASGYVGTVIPWTEEAAGQAHVVHLRKQSEPVSKTVNPKHEETITEVIRAAIAIDGWLESTHSHRGSEPQLKALV